MAARPSGPTCSITLFADKQTSASYFAPFIVHRRHYSRIFDNKVAISITTPIFALFIRYCNHVIDKPHPNNSKAKSQITLESQVWRSPLGKAVYQWYNPPGGEVSELADEHDLGSCAARRAGSSPAFPIGRRCHGNRRCPGTGRELVTGRCSGNAFSLRRAPQKVTIYLTRKCCDANDTY